MKNLLPKILYILFYIILMISFITYSILYQDYFYWIIQFIVLTPFYLTISFFLFGKHKGVDNNE